MPHAAVASAARHLRAFNPAKLKLLVGLDGFVDNIIDVVDQRIDARHYTRVETIGQFGERIRRAAGLSSNIEFVVRQTKLGGNGPIMANALIQAGCGVTYIGNVGKEAVHPVFADMAARCQACYRLADPALTDALEFRDGKLMLGKHQPLKEITYARMLSVVGLKKLRHLWQNAQLVALTNWTMLPCQTDIWQRLLKDMARVRPPAGAILFVDLADPEKRPAREIAAACRLLKKFRSSHRVVLGVNQKESLEVGTALGLKLKPGDIVANAVTLRRALSLDVVVIHPTRNAACATEDATALVEGPYCAQPKLTTGAGDNFNAGFCIGLLAGMGAAESLACGAANSGFYVRHGRSATRAELGRFLAGWAAGQVNA